MPKYISFFEDACKKIMNERGIHNELENINFLSPLNSYSNYIMCKFQKNYIKFLRKNFTKGLSYKKPFK